MIDVAAKAIVIDIFRVFGLLKITEILKATSLAFCLLEFLM